MFPTIDARGLGDVLKQYVVLSYTVAIAGIQVSADGAQATVTATINQRGAARVGNVPPQSRSAVFRMKKTGTQWIIENVTIR